MSDGQLLHVPHKGNFTASLAADEYDFISQMPHDLGVPIANIIRDAEFANLMPSANPLPTARENHVTALARVDKWRCDRAAQQPAQPPLPPQQMR